MHLLCHSFPDTQDHAQVGAPICFGVTLTPVTPAVADRYVRLSSAKIIDANAATAELVRRVSEDTRELEVQRRGVESSLALARSGLEEAQKLASMPVLGTETATIGTFIQEIDTMLGETMPVTTRLDRLRTYLPFAMGIDVAAITQALERAQQETEAIEAIRVEIAGVRQALIEAAKVASDPATLAGLAKLKTNVKLTRALTPERIAEFERILGTLRSVVSQLDGEVAVLGKAIQ